MRRRTQPVTCSGLERGHAAPGRPGFLGRPGKPDCAPGTGAGFHEGPRASPPRRPRGQPREDQAAEDAGESAIGDGPGTDDLTEEDETVEGRW